MINLPKILVLNSPLLIALLITSLIHFLLIAALKIEFSEIAKKHHALEITLIKPPRPLLNPPVSVKSVPHTAKPIKKSNPTEQLSKKSKKVTNRSVDSAYQPKAKKRTKVHHRVVETAPHIPEQIPPEPAIATIVPSPEAKVEIEAVKPVEPIAVVPAIPKPEPIAPEAAVLAEPVDLPSPSIIEKPVLVAEKTDKKSTKISKKSRKQQQSQPQLSLDDLAAQIAQVGEKFGNQTSSSGESRIKTIDAVTHHKASARQYKQNWRHKIERIANLNFPEIARQKDFSARLVIEVGINSDGSLHNVRIRKSSGTPALDAAVKNIVQMGAPFGALPRDLVEELDVLIFQQPMSFSDESGMTAQ